MLILALCIFLADPFRRELIVSPLLPDHEATPRSTAANLFWASITAAYFMSRVLQLLMNHIDHGFDKFNIHQTSHAELQGWRV
jgi:hypothetical protein